MEPLLQRLTECRRFFRARGYNVDNAYQQYKITRDWRDKNDLIELYDSIEVSHYEETRKLVSASL